MTKKIDLCRKLFKTTESLPFCSQHIYFLFYCMWWTTNIYLQRT